MKESLLILIALLIWAAPLWGDQKADPAGAQKVSPKSMEEPLEGKEGPSLHPDFDTNLDVIRLTVARAVSDVIDSLIADGSPSIFDPGQSLTPLLDREPEEDGSVSLQKPARRKLDYRKRPS